ncbi:MAG TPA: hypothetical protein VGO56_12655 [Pyrinomonadaceae bacterium]|jgi:hypothetical protein|nr:hypothetical protein [Pyrinomonadaceae bacterium]
MSTAKTFIKFRWIFPGVYLIGLFILIVGMFMGAGHTPRRLDFLANLIAAPCYLLDILKLDRWIPDTLLFDIIICVIVGLAACWIVGFILDIAVLKILRSSTSNES